MEDRSQKISEFISLLERQATQDGLNPTSVSNLFVGRSTQPDPLQPQVTHLPLLLGHKAVSLSIWRANDMNTVMEIL